MKSHIKHRARRFTGNRLGPRWRGDSGQSMVIVVMAALVLVLASVAVVNEGILQLPLAKHEVDYQKALNAAEAGVQDYINRLNQNPDYWIYSASNPPTPADPAFTSWEAIPGPAPNGSDEYFFYTVNATNTPQTGMVTLSSSGLAGTTVRTITVGLRPASFLDNSYFTVYEMGDPTDPNLYPGQNSGPIVTNVTIPYCITESNVFNNNWGGYGPDFSTSNPPPQLTYGCQPLFWGTGETVVGPARSDDTFFICGSPNFEGPVTSAAWTSQNPGYIDMSNPSMGYQHISGCNSNPTFNGKPKSQGGTISSGAYLTMPSTNASLKSQADPSTGNGCLYTGQTTITFNGTTMTVNSPNSPLGTGAGYTKSSCVGSNVALPPNGVIYVQTSGKSSCAASTNPSGKQWLVSDKTCAGDLFVQGSITGQVTVASDSSVYLPGSLCLSNDNVCTSGGAPTSSDLLTGTSVIGVVANQFVEAYNPVTGQCNSSTYVCSVPSNLTIDGAVLDLNHAFTIQNLSKSSLLGTFTVNGAMSEYYPPLTGLSNGSQTVRGFANTNNFYDARLQTLSPPYFLNPVNSAWQRVSFAEGPPASGLPAFPPSP